MSALLVSDRDREFTVGLLREHWVTGRLTAEEFEQRVGEACAARYSADLWRALRWLPVPLPAQPTRGNGSGTAAIVLSLLGWCAMFFTLGFGSPLALPLFIAAWGTGTAPAGVVLAIAGVVARVLFIAGCAAVVTGF